VPTLIIFSEDPLKKPNNHNTFFYSRFLV